MFDAVMKGALAAVGLTEEEANAMIRGAFQKLEQMHETMNRCEARLRRLEKAAGLSPLQEVLPPATEDEENGGERRSETG